MVTNLIHITRKLSTVAILTVVATFLYASPVYAFTGVLITPTLSTDSNITFSTVDNSNVYFRDDIGYGCTKLDINGYGSAPYTDLVLGLSGGFGMSGALTNGFHTVTVDASSCAPSADGFEYFTYHVTGGQIDEVNGFAPTGTTRITSIVPTGTIATSSSYTFEVHGYVDPADFTFLKTHLLIRVGALGSIATQDAFLNVNNLSAVDGFYDLLIPTSGFFDEGTTTTKILPQGVYTIYVAIQNPKYQNWFTDFLGLNYNETIVSSSTTFTLVAPTAFNQILLHQQGIITSLAESTTTDQILNVCSISSFNFLDCITLTLYGIFTPDKAQLAGDVDNLKQGLFSRAPFGYVTRALDILNGSTTAELPTISYKFGSSSAFKGETLRLDPWSSLKATSTNLLATVSDSDHPQSLWDIVDPYISIGLYLGLLLKILSELLGLDFIGGGLTQDQRGKPFSKGEDEAYRYKEWLYNNKK